MIDYDNKYIEYLEQKCEAYKSIVEMHEMNAELRTKIINEQKEIITRLENEINSYKLRFQEGK